MKSEFADKSASFARHLAKLQRGYDLALDATGFDGVLLHSGRGLRQRTVDDQYWPLKINPSFAHWLPVTDADTLVLIRKGAKPILIRPQHYEFWEGPAPQPDDFYQSSFDLIQCAPEDIAKALPNGSFAWVGDAIEAAKELDFNASAINPASLLAELDQLRVLKSDYEIQCLAGASKIAAAGHAQLETLFAQGHYSELDLHLEYLRITQQNASDTPYSNIVAQGANAAVLHHVHYTRQLDARADLSLLVDAGAMVMGYASDITRTYVRGQGQGAEEFGNLIAGVERLELVLCAMIKPGLAYEELHNTAHQLLAQLLLEAGIAQDASAEALVETGITRVFFPHGLGHSLGLQVHDVGCRLVPPADVNPFLRNTATIAEGQVFTVEPGCYFIEGLLAPLRADSSSKYVCWPKVDLLRPFGGIRIEDNLVVSSDASINLTRDNWPSQP